MYMMLEGPSEYSSACYLLSLLQFFFSNNERRASVAFRREIHQNEVGMETAEREPAAEKDTGKKKEKEENK